MWVMGSYYGTADLPTRAMRADAGRVVVSSERSTARSCAKGRYFRRSSNTASKWFRLSNTRGLWSASCVLGVSVVD